MASGGFGVPLPLPGQKDRKPVLKESDRLHLDAMKMEERLEKLKFQLSREQERRDRTSKIGGSTWRSARADQTPAIRGYAKEVQRQIQAKKAMASASLSSMRREAGGRPAAAEPTSSATTADIWQRDPIAWSVRDTMTWLACLNLAQYQEPFAKNEISGPILMEIGLDDLDYMGITVLAHRKVLLKAVEDLRHGPRPPQPPTKQQEQQQPRPADAARRPNPAVVPSSRREEKVLVSRARKINGEDEESEMQYAAMQGGAGGGGLLHGQYDEKQASASFQEALRDWRQGTTGGGSRAGGSVAGREATPEQDSSRQDEEEEDEPPPEPGMWRNPFATPRSLTAEDDDGHGQSGGGGGGGALWGKKPDEDQEHEAFAAAVEAWRRGRSGSNNKEEDEEASGPSLLSRQEEQERRRRSLDRAAKDLQAKLEEEHRQCREDLARRKEEALRQLSQASTTPSSDSAPLAASAPSPCGSPVRAGDMKEEDEEDRDLRIGDEDWRADEGKAGEEEEEEQCTTAFVVEEEVEVVSTSVRIEEVGTVMGYTPRTRRRRNPLTGMMEEEEEEEEEQEYSVVEGESDDGEAAGEGVDDAGSCDGQSSVTVSF